MQQQCVLTAIVVLGLASCGSPKPADSQPAHLKYETADGRSYVIETIGNESTISYCETPAATPICRTLQKIEARKLAGTLADILSIAKIRYASDKRYGSFTEHSEDRLSLVESRRRAASELKAVAKYLDPESLGVEADEAYKAYVGALDRLIDNLKARYHAEFQKGLASELAPLGIDADATLKANAWTKRMAELSLSTDTTHRFAAASAPVLFHALMRHFPPIFGAILQNDTGFSNVAVVLSNDENFLVSAHRGSSAVELWDIKNLAKPIRRTSLGYEALVGSAVDCSNDKNYYVCSTPLISGMAKIADDRVVVGTGRFLIVLKIDTAGAGRLVVEKELTTVLDEMLAEYGALSASTDGKVLAVTTDGRLPAEAKGALFAVQNTGKLMRTHAFTAFDVRRNTFELHDRSAVLNDTEAHVQYAFPIPDAAEAGGQVENIAFDSIVPRAMPTLVGTDEGASGVWGIADGSRVVLDTGLGISVWDQTGKNQLRRWRELSQCGKIQVEPIANVPVAFISCTNGILILGANGASFLYPLRDDSSDPFHVSFAVARKRGFVVTPTSAAPAARASAQVESIDFWPLPKLKCADAEFGCR